WEQYCGYTEDEIPDRSWEKDQHPRHDAVLAKLMDRAFALGNTDFLLELMLAAQWSRGPDVDAVLAVLVSNPNAELRDAAVQAVGGRLRKPKSLPHPPLQADPHQNPQTPVYPAAGLGRRQRPRGRQLPLSDHEEL